MKKLVCLGAAMVVLVASADEPSLLWNGPDGGAWNAAGELNWLSGETSVAWIDGASVSFGADTNVSLSGTVVVSNLTAEGALKLDGVVVSTYEDFVPKNAPSLVFPGLTLADISGIWGEMGGASMSSGSRTFSAYGYHFFPTNQGHGAVPGVPGTHQVRTRRVHGRRGRRLRQRNRHALCERR